MGIIPLLESITFSSQEWKTANVTKTTVALRKEKGCLEPKQWPVWASWAVLLVESFSRQHMEFWKGVWFVEKILWHQLSCRNQAEPLPSGLCCRQDPQRHCSLIHQLSAGLLLHFTSLLAIYIYAGGAPHNQQTGKDCWVIKPAVLWN